MARVSRNELQLEKIAPIFSPQLNINFAVKLDFIGERLISIKRSLYRFLFRLQDIALLEQRQTITYDRILTSGAVVFYLLSTEEPLTTAAPLGIMLKEYYGVHLTFIINRDNGLTAVRKELLIILLPTEPKLSKFEKYKM